MGFRVWFNFVFFLILGSYKVAPKKGTTLETVGSSFLGGEPAYDCKGTTVETSGAPAKAAFTYWPIERLLSAPLLLALVHSCSVCYLQHRYEEHIQEVRTKG